MQKLIITIAPTGNVPTKAMTPHVPVTPKEIAEDIVRCYEAGAAVAHIHARDGEGRPTAKAAFFDAILKEPALAACPIKKQLSTGARGTRSQEERAEVLTLDPFSASLATGSSNFPRSGNINEPPLVEHLATVMKERHIFPEIEVFDTAMIANAVRLAEQGFLPTPLHFNLVLGVKGSQPPTAKQLFFLYESLPKDATWTVSVIGAQHVPLSTMAIALGGHVRVGIEDNIYYSHGVLGTNVQMVERIAAIAKAMGRELATPEEVPEIWGVK